MNLLLAPPHLEIDLRRLLSVNDDADGARNGVVIKVRTEVGDLARASRLVVVPGSPDAVYNWALAYCVSSGGDALLLASEILAEAAAAADRPGALVLHEAKLRADPGATLRQAARFLGLDSAGSGALAAANVARAPDDARFAALHLYERGRVEGDAQSWWPPDLFRSDEAGFPGAIDITGAARILTYGPYFALPPGSWRAELWFELCADATRYDFPIEFGGIGDFSLCVARADRPGAQRVSLDHDFAAPTVAEVRLWLGRAAFHGMVTLLGASIRRVAPGNSGGFPRALAAQASNLR